MGNINQQNSNNKVDIDMGELDNKLENMARDISDIKVMLSAHVEINKNTKECVDHLEKQVNGNGKVGLVDRVNKLYTYVYIGFGIVLAIGGLWSIVTLILPLFVHSKNIITF